MKQFTTVVLLVALLLLGQCAFADDGPADADSVHLWWHPDAEAAQTFYNEVTVERSTNGTFFCVCAWDIGYMGIQQLGDGKKVAIFSVWDPETPAAAGASPAEKQVQVMYCDPIVKTQRFGGEGTGQQAYYDFPWEIGTTYKFLVRARKIGNRTAYVSFIFEPRTNAWKHLATFTTRPSGSLLHGLYSFVEDFRRDYASAREERVALFSNGWIRRSDAQWQALDSATFTAYDAKRTNIDAWVNGPNFGLATGGHIQNRHLHVNDKMATQAHDRNSPPVENVRASN